MFRRAPGVENLVKPLLHSQFVAHRSTLHLTYPGARARECVIALLVLAGIAVGLAWRCGAANLSWRPPGAGSRRKYRNSQFDSRKIFRPIGSAGPPRACG